MSGITRYIKRWCSIRVSRDIHNIFSVRNVYHVNRHMPYFLNSAPTRGACLRRCTIRWQWDADQNGLTCKRVFCMRCMPISIFFSVGHFYQENDGKLYFFISFNEPSLSKEAYHSELLICRTLNNCSISLIFILMKKLFSMSICHLHIFEITFANDLW